MREHTRLLRLHLIDISDDDDDAKRVKSGGKEAREGMKRVKEY